VGGLLGPYLRDAAAPGSDASAHERDVEEGTWGVGNGE